MSKLMNTTSLFSIFRDALLALIPVFEEAGIGWRDQDQYDQFDKIASALFDSIVLEPIRYKKDIFGSALEMRYGYGEYVSTNDFFFSVEDGERKTLGKFAEFGTKRNPFDIIFAWDDELSCRIEVDSAVAEIVLRRTPTPGRHHEFPGNNT
jgi:hypothetical protein